MLPQYRHGRRDAKPIPGHPGGSMIFSRAEARGSPGKPAGHRSVTRQSPQCELLYVPLVREPDIMNGTRQSRLALPGGLSRAPLSSRPSAG